MFNVLSGSKGLYGACCLLLLIVTTPGAHGQARQGALGEFKPSKQREVLSADARLELLWGQSGFTEGPTADHEGSILFTDCPNNRIMRFSPESGKTDVWLDESHGAGGLKATSDGTLVVLQGANGGGRRLVSIKDGEHSIIVDQIDSKKFNSPNDVDIAPNGDIYFTDPRYSGDEKRELDFEGVFFVRDGVAHLATDTTERPNGILISQDGSHAYVADNNNQAGGRRTLERFKINEDGTFGEKKTLFTFRNDQRGIDGMAMDVEGNIYATAGLGKYAGIYVFSPEGEHLAFIDFPDFPTNCTFGGPDERSTLYITGQVITGNTKPMTMGLYRIKLNKKGYQVK